MNKKVKIGICGNYSKKYADVGGQNIKTQLITDALKEKYGESNVAIADTSTSKVRLIFKCFSLAKNCENIIIIVARKGVRVIIPLFVLLSKMYSIKTHYVVIGAWICDVVKKSFWLKRTISKIDYIYPETQVLKDKLTNHIKLKNVEVMYNYKDMDIINPDDFEKHKGNTYKVCCVSRIEPKKGLQDAIDVVSRINNDQTGKKVVLDIYGPIKDNYKDEFLDIIEKHEFVNYCGVIQPDETIYYIKNYYLLLFPTKYYTEGIPGTLIDAYFSGVPVVSSRWESCSELIDEGKTGASYDFDDLDDFYNKLINLFKNEGICFEMKKNCIRVAEKFTRDSALKVLLKNLG